MKDLINWIKKTLDDVEAGKEGKPSKYYGFAAYTALCSVVGGYVPLAYGDWSSGFWHKALPIVWLVIITDIAILIGACLLGRIAQKGVKLRRLTPDMSAYNRAPKTTSTPISDW